MQILPKDTRTSASQPRFTSNSHETWATLSAGNLRDQGHARARKSAQFTRKGSGIFLPSAAGQKRERKRITDYDRQGRPRVRNVWRKISCRGREKSRRRAYLY